ncbi:hypothetical protein [Streptomyces sp. NPDC059861]|uniref:hypothetical protein n=1 Tax=Streptomyces sp. NPDC059861 TaxID=3346974 RepID=UPI00364F46F7
MVDEVRADRGQQGVGGEVGAGETGEPVQGVAEGGVPPVVVRVAVRAVADARLLQGEGEVAGVELEAEQGVE